MRSFRNDNDSLRLRQSIFGAMQKGEKIRRRESSEGNRIVPGGLSRESHANRLVLARLSPYREERVGDERANRLSRRTAWEKDYCDRGDGPFWGGGGSKERETIMNLLNLRKSETRRLRTGLLVLLHRPSGGFWERGSRGMGENSPR